MDDTRDRLWPVLRNLMKLHTFAYRATGGRVGQRFRGSPPMLLLDHRGARSGTKRTSPLVYLRDGADIVIVASKGGHAAHPAWLHNLRAHPDTTVQIGSVRLAVGARVADPHERVRLWPKVVELYSGYEVYQQRTAREIPLVILEPR